MNPQNHNPNQPNIAAPQARAMTAANVQRQPMQVPGSPAVQPVPTTGSYGAPMMQPQIAQPQQPIASAPGTVIEAPHTTENPLSTQSTLLFSELRDGLIIMKDGSFRAVVACQSINFDLMSEQEREGVEYSYQNFLNSLNFTIQILVR